MGTLKPQNETSFDENAVAGAIAVLADAARKNLPAVRARLLAAGFEVVAYRRLQATQDVDASIASDIGEVIEGRGIYHGAWQPRPNSAIVHAYSCKDFLKDASGEQLLLTWYEASAELSRRNNGRRYGNGTEAALSDALAKPSGAKGAYGNGDLVIAPEVLLNGQDADGNKIRSQNTYDLSRSNGDVFQDISRTLSSGFPIGRWSWSCSEARDDTSHVMAVRLSDGLDDWLTKDYGRLGVLPFRIFREPHAVRAVSHLIH
jgi:hypothetical protein